MTLSVRPPYRVLLITDDRETVDRIRTELDGSGPEMSYPEHENSLSSAIAHLHIPEVDAVLFNFALVRGNEIERLQELVEFTPRRPVLLLAHSDQEEMARRAVELGALNYLMPKHFESYALSRAIHNAIQQYTSEDALYVEMDRASVTLNSIGDAVLCTDLSGAVSYLNLVAEKLTGWSREEAAGHPLGDVLRIVDSLTRQIVPNPFELAIRHNRTVRPTPHCVLIGIDGIEFGIEDSVGPIHDRAGNIIGAAIVFHDVSAARGVSGRLAHAAHHDALTNLPNRLLLRDRISQAISLSHRKHRPFAVMFLDLDHFKMINDSLGHSVGDKLLKAVAQRLVHALRGSDTVSRIGGDEFAILLPETEHAGDASSSAKKLLAALAAPYLIEANSIQICGTIGISLYPQHGVDADTLLHNADVAMYHAKNLGRNTFQFFSAEMNLQSIARQALASDLLRALEQDEFRLHYQPKVSLATNQITGAEALIRWQEPERGLLAPSDFIQMAESTGLIVKIGRWVMLEACRQARLWQRSRPSLTMAVNVSALEFLDKEFIKYVKSVLAETDLSPGHLQLELTEGVLMKNAEETMAVLAELKSIGVLLAVDDFGTGYSSLSYLRQFPIDILKIDRSFVSQISPNVDDCVLVSAIIAMGKSLRHLVVAEGIETQAQRTFLQTQRCAEGQGFLFSHPIPPSHFTKLLQTGIAC